MLAEAIIDTGWTVEYVLSMPARRFFVLRREMAKSLEEKRSLDLIEQCDIAWIPNSTPEYLNSLKAFYKSGLAPDNEKKKVNIRTFDADNDKENKAAGDILAATFRQKKKLMGLG